MAKSIMLAGSVVLGLGMASLAAAQPACEAVAKLERVESVVKVQPAGAAFPLRKLELPHALCAGDEVFSLSKGKALISYDKGELVLAANSRLRVKSAGQMEALEGQLLFDIEKQANEVVQVHTPLIVIGVKGTRFLLSLAEPMSAVALVSGLIDVKRQDEQEVALYQAKPLSEMSAQEYEEQIRAQFAEFSRQQQGGFAEYKQQLQTEFTAYKKSVELKPGNQLVFAQEGEQPVALHEQINADNQRVQTELAQWLD